MNKAIAIILVLVTLYFVAWPVDIVPVAWDPTPVQDAASSPAEGLQSVQRIGGGKLPGPETITFDAQGRLYTGLEDGRVVRLSPDLRECEVLGETGGRPLGIALTADGEVLVADAQFGLGTVTAEGGFEVMADQSGGIPLRFVDDLAIDAEGVVYFSDASWKFGYDQVMLDVLEHGSRGRLLRYADDTGEAVTLMAELDFANGVALGPDDDFVLVNETSAYRITRFWLRGDRAGQREVFADGLPGFPDNITFNGRDRFWVALFSARSELMDWLAPRPFLRAVLARLPRALHPGPDGGAMVLGLDLDGNIVEHYRFDGPEAYQPVTSVREHAGMLYLGSLKEGAIGRVPLAPLRAGQAGAGAAAWPAISCRAG